MLSRVGSITGDRNTAHLSAQGLFINTGKGRKQVFQHLHFFAPLNYSIHCHFSSSHLEVLSLSQIGLLSLFYHVHIDLHFTSHLSSLFQFWWIVVDPKHESCFSLHWCCWVSPAFTAFVATICVRLLNMEQNNDLK